MRHLRTNHSNQKKVQVKSKFTNRIENYINAHRIKSVSMNKANSYRDNR